MGQHPGINLKLQIKSVDNYSEKGGQHVTALEGSMLRNVRCSTKKEA